MTLRISLLRPGIRLQYCSRRLWSRASRCVLSGCVQTDFPPEKAQGLILEKPIHLDAEEMTLTSQQVDCGVQNDLWEQPVASSAINSGFVRPHSCPSQPSRPGPQV